MSARVKALLKQLQDQEQRIEDLEDEHDRLTGQIETLIQRVSELERWRAHLAAISEREQEPEPAREAASPAFPPLRFRPSKRQR